MLAVAVDVAVAETVNRYQPFPTSATEVAVVPEFTWVAPLTGLIVAASLAKAVAKTIRKHLVDCALTKTEAV